MKKLLVAVAVLGVGGYFAWGYIMKPGRSACSKMAELCGEKSDSCTGDLEDMRKNLGDEPLRKFDACVAEAKTCPEAAGCLVGAGASGVGDAMGKFLKGVSNGLKK
jgi:hypothetical protein